MKTNPLLLIDAYKAGHHLQYPEGTEYIYCNFTPRSVKRMPNMAKEIVSFGSQYALKYIHDIFKEGFFDRNKEEVLSEAKKLYSNYLGSDYDVSHFEKLHDLGYLPIKVKAIDEGTIIGEKIPILTIINTLPEFFWIPNFLETLISSLLWKPMHSASIAYGFRKILQEYALETDKDNLGFVDFQGHDFSFRGMQHPESAISSGMGWLTCFKGTDTVPAVDATKYYYNTDNAGFSVMASEHSVACAYGRGNEFEYFEHLITKFPNGILSLVSDSYDLWAVITDFLPRLKDKIISRNGKVVIRPDSGDPVDIICGCEKEIHAFDFYSIDLAKYYYKEILLNKESEIEYFKFKGKLHSIQLVGEDGLDVVINHVDRFPYQKGVVELLWDIFGGTINEQGYKVLDPHIGCIYGDSITLERAEEICERLKDKGFASTNVVLGVGSYSLSYATRDSQGVACKATWCTVNGEEREIFKDPITDNGEKKSSRGLLMVYEEDGLIKLKDQCTKEEESKGLLRLIYEDGEIIGKTNLEDIRLKILNKI